MLVNVKIYNESSNPIPKYSKVGDAGMDIRANSRKLIMAGKRELIKTGIYLELPIGYEMQVRGRSGLAIKHGIEVLNAPGTIDSGYRGEVGVILLNTSKIPFQVEIGDRIAQIVLKEQPTCVLHPVEFYSDLNSSDRGSDGYGSTGITTIK